MPKVSVVIPIYNTGKFLNQCIDSVLSQTLQDIELICVNDGSTDNSLEIIQQYAKNDSRVKVLTKNNAGYGHTMNMGLNAATGDYFAIVESDDYILPNMLETLYSLAIKNDLDIVRGGYYKFYEFGLEEKRVYCSSMAAKYTNVVFCPRNTSDLPLSAVVTPSGIYKMSFLRSIAFQYSESPGGAFQDHGLWFKSYMLADKVLFIPEAFYMYRFDNPNSSIYSKSILDKTMAEYNAIGEFVEQNTELSYIHLPAYWLSYYLSGYFALKKMARILCPQVIKPLAEVFLEAEKSGKLDLSLFSKNQLVGLHRLMHEPRHFVKIVKADTSHAMYLEHIELELGGNTPGYLHQFYWYRKNYGILYALKLALRKIIDIAKKRGKSRLKKIRNKCEQWKSRINPEYANQKKVISEMQSFMKTEKTRRYRDNQMFWWSMNLPGETMTETKQRFFYNMPKAEGALREKQIGHNTVLVELKRILDENNIPFWPMGGTLIGAVRHGGFIPWDDDIDISMLYSDKSRLFEVVNKSDTLCVEEAYWTGTKTIYRCPVVRSKDESCDGYIEVFLWDSANDEATNFAPLWKKRNEIVKALNDEYRKLYISLHRKDYFREPVTIEHDRLLLEKLYDKYRMMCVDKIGTGGSTIYGAVDMSYENGKWCAVYKSEEIFPMSSCSFEGEIYTCPKNTDKLLRDQFGDYMEIPNNVTPHHSR